MTASNRLPVEPTGLHEFATFQQVGNDTRIPFTFGQLVYATRGGDEDIRRCVVKFSNRRYVHVPSLLHVLSGRVLSAA